MKKALIIDGNNLIFKTYYATAYQGTNLHSSQGVPTNALYAFIRMLTKYLKENHYDTIFVAFDAGKTTFRTKIFDNYKATRSSTPTELLMQLELVKEFLNLAQISWMQKDNYEADDLIGTMCNSGKDNYKIDIISSDKDLYQLLSDNVQIILPEKGLSTIKIFDQAALKIKYEIEPKQIVDLKGLMGDSSDNLPGIKGIGPKTAIKLLKEYDNLENILANTHNLNPTIAQKLKTYESQGVLTKKIAQLDLFVPINLNLDNCNYDINLLNNEKLQAFYKKYNMNSLIMNNNYNQKQTNEHKSKIEVLDKWNPKYNSTCNFIWTEVCWDNYHRDQVTGIAIKNEHGLFYLNQKVIINSKEFQDFLKNPNYQKITWDIKKTYIAIKNNFNINIAGFIFDHMLASYLLYSNENINYENISAILNIDNITIISNDDFYGKGAKRILINDDQKVAAFLEKKINFLDASYDILINKLKANNNWKLYQEIELPTVYALIMMEENGICVDREQLKNISTKVNKQLKILENKINEIANKPINANSPKQISTLLFDDLKLPNRKKNSTASEVLINLKNSHPIINVLLEYRKLQKLYSTYLNGLEKYIFPDNKIHTIYNQVQASTGRISSIEPNMQNITVKDLEQKEVRKIFISSNKNYKVVSFDYSQIELRLLADISNDKNLINAFINNHDIHLETASKIFNLPLNQVSKEQRSKAKAVNFGIIYGISAFGLAQQLKINTLEAKEFIERYFLVYPDIKNYIKKIVSFCEENNYVATIFNRKRYVPEINNKNEKIKEFGQRIAMNMPIQGSCADIIKLAMIKIEEEIKAKKISAKLIAQVHDELIFEIKEDEVAQNTAIINEIMTTVIKLKVPLIVNSSVGNNWYDLK